MTLDHLGLMEKRDERLVGGLNEHELEGVAVVGDTLKSRDYGLQCCAASNYTTKSKSGPPDIGRIRHLLLPIPAISLSEKMAFSRKSAQPRACSMKVGGRRCAKVLL